MSKKTEKAQDKLRDDPKYANYTSIEFRAKPLDRLPNDWVFLGTEKVNGDEYCVYGRDMEQAIVKVVQERDHALRLAKETATLKETINSQRMELGRRDRKIEDLERTNKSLADLLGQMGASIRPPKSETEEKDRDRFGVGVVSADDFEASI